MKTVSLKNIQAVRTVHKSGKKKVMIANGEINSLTQFAQVSFAPGEIVEPHQHPDMYEIFLVEQGKGSMFINKKEYKLEKGMCLVLEPGEMHEVVNTDDKDLVLTYFSIAYEK